MKNNFSLAAATSIVVANMIGTGVFATMGLQADLLKSVPLIILSWVLGAITAFTGAMSYAKLATVIPGSGGEYHYLSVLYSPAVGFAAGVVSVLSGFAAPLALTSISFGYYLENVVHSNPVVLAIILIVALTVLHGVSAAKGGKLHLSITALKICIIIGFACSMLLYNNSGHERVDTVANEVSQSDFATALLYVLFTYSGWNAACYISEEIGNTKINTAYALLIGTGVVTLLYLLLCCGFLTLVPLQEGAHAVDFLHEAASQMWGSSGANVMDVLIAFMLMSSASSLVITGPRVLMKMKNALSYIRIGSHQNLFFVALQSLIAVMLIMSFSFEIILRYTGLALSVFTVMTVAGLFYSKRNMLSAFYKIAAVVFLTINGWVIAMVLQSSWLESLISLSTIAIGMLVYRCYAKLNQKVKV